MSTPTLLHDLDARQRGSTCGSHFGCHTGNLILALKIIHDPSTAATRRQNKVMSAGRLLFCDNSNETSVVLAAAGYLIVVLTFLIVEHTLKAVLPQSWFGSD